MENQKENNKGFILKKETFFYFTSVYYFNQENILHPI